MARLFLNAGQTFGFIGDFDPTLSVFGTNANETVFLNSQAIATFDASFNRGGDELIIDGNAADYSGRFEGSNFVLTDDLGTLVRIPFGTAGMTLTFNDGSHTLILQDGQVLLGDQVITSTSEVLDDTDQQMSMASLVQEPEPSSSFSTEEVSMSALFQETASESISVADSAPESPPWLAPDFLQNLMLDVNLAGIF